MQVVDAGPGCCQFIWITDFLPPDIRGNLAPLIEQGARAEEQSGNRFSRRTEIATPRL